MRDVTGWRVLSYDGQEIGTVEEMVEDPNSGEVEALVVTTREWSLTGSGSLRLDMAAAQLDEENEVVLAEAGHEPRTL
jgi:sporulation protein YlmC with PRC-barrel domain